MRTDKPAASSIWAYLNNAHTSVHQQSQLF